ncbi:MAG: hypothetical protein GVY28_03915, partial [Alphaproteobacteria bacterium]|nr:hypothetical protein [Alphaproteobacteria bacterium]
MTAVSAHSPYNPPPEPGRPETARRYQGELGFWDMVDVVNPLQHLPVVNWVYRGVTGDTIQPPARIAGATLYGGPVGMVGAIADEALAEHSGRYAHEHALGLVTGDEGAPPADRGPVVAEGPVPAGGAAGSTPAPAGPPGQLSVAEGPLP